MLQEIKKDLQDPVPDREAELAEINEALQAEINERRRTEQALRQSRAEFQALLESAPDAIVSVDADGRITLVNSQTEKMFGYPREELLGQPIEILIPLRHHQAHVQHRAGYTASPTTRPMGTGLKLAGRRKDGSEFPVEISLSPVRAQDGFRVMSIIREITERRKAEEEIEKLNEELEHRVNELATVNQELETFSYSVSHDLRAPLRAIAGFSQALEEDYADVLDRQGRDYARRVNAATQRLNQLIDDMLTLSRVTRSEMNRDTDVDLSAMAQSIMAPWQATQPDRQVEIVIQPNLETRGDPRLLRIALENLFANAWKFTSKVPQARIELGTAGTEGDRTIYFVRDNGAGFDMTYSDKLFGPFQRLHAATEFPGTGIGLATVQRIIHRHGGRVWADSTVGEGATFYFTL